MSRMDAKDCFWEAYWEMPFNYSMGCCDDWWATYCMGGEL